MTLRKRRVLKGMVFALGAIVLLLLLLVLSFPVWFPWVFKPLAASNGLHFTSYERKGYRHFLLQNVTFTNADVHFRAKQVEALTPTIWLWRSWRNSGATQNPFLHASEWQLDLQQKNAPAPTGEPSTYTNVLKLADIVGVLRRWLPAAELQQGKLTAGKTSIVFPQATWTAGNLVTVIDLPDQKQSAKIDATLKDFPFNADIHSDSAKIETAITISTNPRGLDIKATGSWQTNRFDWQAHFGSKGTLPETAYLSAPNFRIPGEIVRMADYQDIIGQLRLDWTNGQYTVDLTAKATPLASSTNAPPGNVTVHARGDTNLVRIESGLVSMPWAQAKISPGTTLHFSGPLLQEAAQLQLTANLDKQSWIKVHGVLEGQAELKAGKGNFPDGIIRLSGTNAGTAEVEAKTFILEANAAWPALEIVKADATFDDGSTVQLTGQMDWDAKNISTAKLHFQGPMAGRWLPANYGYENAIVDINVQGALTNLSHNGQATITNVAIPQLTPLQLQLAWTGQQSSLTRTELYVRNTNASISTILSASADMSRTNAPPILKAELTTLSLSTTNGETLALTRPAQFLFEPSNLNTNGWIAKIKDFDLAGTAGNIGLNADMHWPSNGVLSLLATNLHPEIVNAFRTEPIEPATIHQLSSHFGWTNGPLTFEIAASAETSLKLKNPRLKNTAAERGIHAASTPDSSPELVSAQISLHGDGKGVAITNLALRSQTSTVAVAQGLIPLSIHPAAGTNLVQLDTKKPAQFTLKTEPHSIFWQRFSEWTGAVLRDPLLAADVSGTWEAPRGRVQIRAEEITLPTQRTNLPRMEHLEFDLGLDREVATLTNFSVLVQGQRVSATGRMPLGERFWTDLRQKKAPNWEQASGQVEIKEAQISAFAGLFPALLAPQGTFHLTASLAQGGKLSGELALRQARTRPLPSVGPIRDIDVTLRFVERTIKLAGATATIGGSPIMAAGEGDLSGTEWLKGEPPPFEFVLFGTNVPLSRQPDSIIRSDLNLAIKKTNGAPPLIAGSVRVRDSYYLSDLADLVPGKAASAERRPPYFSVEEPGLADWRLAVRVGGERGLKVRSTLFNGQVSPNLRIQGTLKEPLALGDVKIDSGTVKFPFASLEVQRGYVTLTSEDPYRPHLMISAASKKFSYDVRMELSGPADQPIIQFTSTPPLSSEQLVLMVTAGELPKGGYTLNPSQRAQTMALFLGKDLLSKLGMGDQSEERLSFSSGQEISETGKPTYSLEYKLTDRWSLVGEYDRFNAFNAGLKWKVYSK